MGSWNVVIHYLMNSVTNGDQSFFISMSTPVLAAGLLSLQGLLGKRKEKSE